MNKAKLSALCAKARGWELGILENVNNPAPVWRRSDGIAVVECSKYNPIDDANQASELLEKVADEIGGIWSVGKNRKKTYWCAIMGPLLEFNYFTDHRETQNLAKILCSLRASPEVTDAEINDAMEGE